MNCCCSYWQHYRLLCWNGTLSWMGCRWQGHYIVTKFFVICATKNVLDDAPLSNSQLKVVFKSHLVLSVQEKEGEGVDIKQESKSYQQLVDFLLADQVQLSFCFLLLSSFQASFLLTFFNCLFADCTCGGSCLRPGSQSSFVWIASSSSENCGQVRNITPHSVFKK